MKRSLARVFVVRSSPCERERACVSLSGRNKVKHGDRCRLRESVQYAAGRDKGRVRKSHAIRGERDVIVCRVAGAGQGAETLPGRHAAQRLVAARGARQLGAAAPSEVQSRQVEPAASR